MKNDIICPKVNNKTFICDMINFLDTICSAKQLISFIINLPESELRNIIDSVDNVSDSFIRFEYIKDLVYIKYFFQNLKLTLVKNKIIENEFTFYFHSTEEDFFNIIIKTFKSSEELQQYTKAISNCNSNYNSIQEFYSKLSSQEDSIKNKIKQILNKFTLKIKIYKESNQILSELEVSFISTKKVKMSNKYNNLIELKDKVLLIANDSNNDHDYKTN